MVFPSRSDIAVRGVKSCMRGESAKCKVQIHVFPVNNGDGVVHVSSVEPNFHGGRLLLIAFWG